MEYTLNKSKKIRRCGVRITPSGEVIFKVPYYYSKKDTDALIERLTPWVNKNYDKAMDVSLIKNISNNGFIYILGYKRNIKINLSNKNNVYLSENDLIIESRSLDENVILRLLEKYLNNLRKEIFNAILDKYLKISNLEINELKIKDLKASYGRCYKNRKIIILSKSNIHKRIEFNEAVIVHEICHLVELNHSKRFYDLVLKMYPEYRKQIKWKVY